MYPMLVESIVDNMGLSNREAIIAQLRQVNQPNPQEQEIQQMRLQLEMASAQAQIESVKAGTTETMSRVQQNQVETQLLPVEEETKRIKALAQSMGKDEFERLVEIAKLDLKEKELDMKEEVVKLQMSGIK